VVRQTRHTQFPAVARINFAMRVPVIQLFGASEFFPGGLVSLQG